MCISWLKNLFKDKEEAIADSGKTEPANEIPVQSAETTNEIIEEQNEEPMKKPYEGVNFHVLLDNGHASSTPGKRMQLENGTYFFEYKFNREVVKKIAGKLDELGIPYEILVPEVEKDIALSTRAARANEFCDKYGAGNCFFISVHSNACGDGTAFNNAKGWSVYTTKGNTNSDKYATIMFNEAEKILPIYGMTTRANYADGDPDYEENFTVIYKTKCPAILTENLFFTNKKEVAWLMTEEGKDAIAEVHVKGIEEIIKKTIPGF